MIKHKLMVDSKSYNHKPTDPQFITNRIIKQPCKELTISELADICLEYCFKPSYMTTTKKEGYKSSSLIMLDIDNCYPKTKNKLSRDDGYLNIEDFLSVCKDNNIMPALIFTSHNHTINHNRYRVLFQLADTVYSLDIINSYYTIFKDLFGQCCDPSVKATSISYPGKNIAYIHKDAVVDTKNISLNIVNAANSNGLNAVKCDESLSHIYNPYYNTKDYIYDRFVLDHKVGLNPVLSMVTENFCDDFLLKKYKNKSFISMQSLKDYIRKIPLDLVFSMSKSNIRCLFHKDANPSASIYVNAHGYYYYKCHSCGVHMDIIDMIAKINNISMSNRSYSIKAIKILMKQLKLKVSTNEWYLAESEILEDNKVILQDDLSNIKDRYPMVYKKLFLNEDLLEVMIDVAKKQLNLLKLSDINYNHGVIFKMSSSYAASKIRKHQTTVLKRLDDLMVMGLITKLTDEQVKELSPSVYKSCLSLSNANKHHSKLIQCYIINPWTESLLKKAEDNLKYIKDKGATKNGASRIQYKALGYDTRSKHEITDTCMKNEKLLLTWAERTIKRKKCFLKEDYLKYAKKHMIGESYASRFITTITVELNLTKQIVSLKIIDKYNLKKSSLKKAIFIKQG